jgi:uncharacterized protein
MASLPSPKAATLVTQTRVQPDGTAAFERWLQRDRRAVAGFQGYVDDAVIAPSPPAQVDWVVIQRFANVDAARNWLQSTQRQALLGDVQPLLVGPIDVHLFTEAGAREAPVSAIITTRVKPGELDAFLSWQHRVAVLQARSKGFQGYKLEPPIAGVQDDWAIVLRFDSEAHLEAWLTSSERQQLLEEATDFDAETHIRRVQSGFDFWFPPRNGVVPSLPRGWKQNLVVLVVLYPLVFLFGTWVQTPLLVEQGVPFWFALFIGNIVSVALLGWVLLPAANRLFSWWLNPSGRHRVLADWFGTALMLLLCGVSLFVFARFF